MSKNGSISFYAGCPEGHTMSNKMPILAFTRDAVAASFIPTVRFADL